MRRALVAGGGVDQREGHPLHGEHAEGDGEDREETVPRLPPEPEEEERGDEVAEGKRTGHELLEDDSPHGASQIRP